MYEQQPLTPSPLITIDINQQSTEQTDEHFYRIGGCCVVRQLEILVVGCSVVPNQQCGGPHSQDDSSQESDESDSSQDGEQKHKSKNLEQKSVQKIDHFLTLHAYHFANDKKINQKPALKFKLILTAPCQPENLQQIFQIPARFPCQGVAYIGVVWAIPEYQLSPLQKIKMISKVRTKCHHLNIIKLNKIQKQNSFLMENIGNWTIPAEIAIPRNISNCGYQHTKAYLLLTHFPEQNPPSNLIRHSIVYGQIAIIDKNHQQEDLQPYQILIRSQPAKVDNFCLTWVWVRDLYQNCLQKLESEVYYTRTAFYPAYLPYQNQKVLIRYFYNRVHFNEIDEEVVDGPKDGLMLVDASTNQNSATVLYRKILPEAGQVCSIQQAGANQCLVSMSLYENVEVYLLSLPTLQYLAIVQVHSSPEIGLTKGIFASDDEYFFLLTRKGVYLLDPDSLADKTENMHNNTKMAYVGTMAICQPVLLPGEKIFIICEFDTVKIISPIRYWETRKSQQEEGLSINHMAM